MTHVVTASVTGSGKITSNTGGIDCGSACSATLPANTVLQLTATPAAGQVLQSWGGACATASGNSCSVTVIQATTVFATFAPQPTSSFALTVAVTGNGKVSSQPAGIDCGSSCSATYAAATQVVLTAAPAQGQVLQAWGGACAGTSAACTVTMSEARNVTAAFAAAPAQGMAWGSATLLESSNDFNVADSNTFADANVLSAIDGAGNALVLWEQSDGTPDGSTRKVFSRRYTAGQGWAAAVVVPGLTSSSASEDLVTGRLLLDAAGNAVWIRENFQTRRYNPGTGWSATPFTPANGGGGKLTDAKLDTDGHVHIVGIGNDDVLYSRLPASSNQWPAFVDVSQSTLTTRAAQLALGSQGSLIVVWQERNPGDSNDSMKATRYAGGAWQTPVRLEELLTDVRDASPRIASDAAGNALVAWQQGSSLYVARYDGAANTWGTPTEIDAGQVSDNLAVRIAIAMANDGRAVIGWNASFALKAASYTPSSGFSAPAMVNSYSAGHSLGIDQDGRAVVTYRSPDQWPNPSSGILNLYARELPWGGAWSAATLLETGAGDVKANVNCAANPAGQAVCVWAQDDLANSTVRNSLQSNIRR
ncbi:hypothetical protein G8A07_11430 [Roseateles sp. DAIF2]|uniref:InlB B-repeat-containing protein n=1 Tax=Roseateles sp. DAIF2 TaxID=2714952 RepID=UPI0018A280C9|nr:hypothetical protein [Roseateles sp. DAIF2]QPF73471.1 hypothetical protein G8A07_11430 [Roseateles sp. DAIF2]